jgi:hypothetical protein
MIKNVSPRTGLSSPHKVFQQKVGRSVIDFFTIRFIRFDDSFQKKRLPAEFLKTIQKPCFASLKNCSATPLAVTSQSPQVTHKTVITHDKTFHETDSKRYSYDQSSQASNQESTHNFISPKCWSTRNNVSI